jgi:peptidoglycan biosynthesis protein MviN/MurJ (putative lipid II flippase)
MASSIGMIAYTVTIFALLQRRTRNREAASLLFFLLKIVAASAVSAVVCLNLTKWLEARIDWHAAPATLLILVLLGSLGFLLTALLAMLLRVRELSDYVKMLPIWIPKRIVTALK